MAIPTTATDVRPRAANSDRAAFWLMLLALLIISVTSASHFYAGEPVFQVEESARRAAEFRVDLDKAKLGELTLLPGVGKTLAERIVAARMRRGGFQHWLELQEVKGIGPKKAAALANYVKFGP